MSRKAGRGPHSHRITHIQLPSFGVSTIDSAEADRARGEWGVEIPSENDTTLSCQLLSQRDLVCLSFRNWASIGHCSFCNVANHLDTIKVSVAFKTQKMRTQECHAGAAREFPLPSGSKALGDTMEMDTDVLAGWRTHMRPEAGGDGSVSKVTAMHA